MGEPEDLIIDGAYLASRLARDVWRRYAPAPVDNVVRLTDVRVRIAPRYAPRIFGRAGFTLLRRPDQLPEVLIEVLRRLIRPA